MAVTALVSIVVFAPLLGLAMPAVAEGMGAVDALAFSLNRGLANWPALFALSIIVGVVTTLISSITGGLAQFLTTPWSFCVMSAAYMQAIGDVTKEGA